MLNLTFNSHENLTDHDTLFNCYFHYTLIMSSNQLDPSTSISLTSHPKGQGPTHRQRSQEIQAPLQVLPNPRERHCR